MVATNTMAVTKTIRTLPQQKQWLIVGTTQNGINHFSISCLKCNLYHYFFILPFNKLLFFLNSKCKIKHVYFKLKNAKIFLA